MFVRSSFTFTPRVGPIKLSSQRWSWAVNGLQRDSFLNCEVMNYNVLVVTGKVN